MSPALQAVATDLGLVWCPCWYRDRLFHLALVAGVAFWGGLWLWGAVAPIRPADALSTAFFSLVVWQPLGEELLFRGCLQGLVRQYAWGRRCWWGLSRANIVTSLLFVLGHFWAHPPLWAMAVMVPALLFGMYRDRYRSVYPSMLLHIFYNAGYFALTGG